MNVKLRKSLIALSVVGLAALAGFGLATHSRLLKTRESAVAGITTQIANNAIECTAYPPGGTFASATPVQIKCGKDVISAAYNWNNEKSRQIYNQSAKTVYNPAKNRQLHVKGKYKYKNSKGKIKTSTFTKTYEFKKLLPPAPYPYYYPYPKFQTRTGQDKEGYKITLPTFSQVKDKLK